MQIYNRCTEFLLHFSVFHFSVYHCYFQEKRNWEEEKRNLEEEKKEKRKKQAAYKRDKTKELATSAYVCTSTLPYPNPNANPCNRNCFLIVIL